MAKRLTITNPKQEAWLFKSRLLVCVLAIFLLVMILLARLVYLQYFEHTRFITLSKENQLNLLPIAPNRGLIYDRHGVLIAQNIPIHSLEIFTDKVKDIPATLAALQKILPISKEDLEKFEKLRSQARRFDSVPVVMNLSEEAAASFYVNQFKFPGVIIKSQMIRDYPFNEHLVHILGYVSRINSKELTQVDTTNYSATRFIGKVGIEKYYENILHGVVGYQEVEMDASGRIVRVLNRTPPIPGKNLYLTIDSRLQLLAEQALDNHNGAVVALDPRNGDVLAMVSHPGYDPNLFVQGISNANYKLLTNSEDRPLYNRATRGQYPYASTIKPFLGLGALINNTVTPQYQVFDPGRFSLGKNVWRCWKHGGHGWVNLHKAIKESCDTYFYTIALKMGIEKMAEILSAFGFGQYTGIDILEELPGILATPEWKKRTRAEAWYKGDTVNASIGQGTMLATPLQIAVGTAGLAMRGMIYKPHFLNETQTVGGVKVKRAAELLYQVEAPAMAWEVVIKGMQAVTSEPGGSAYVAYGSKVPYSTAGKTGTAQVFSSKKFRHLEGRKDLSQKLRDHSLFMVFAPVEDPQIALLVIMENEPGAAKYTARKILDAFFALQQGARVADTPPLIPDDEIDNEVLEAEPLPDNNEINTEVASTSNVLELNP